jgi:hypothetical protein
MSGSFINLRDAAGRPVELGLSIYRAYVECIINDRCCAIFDRDGLRAWLAAPVGMLSSDQMSWTHSERGDVVVTIDGIVPRWPLAEQVLAELRSRI